MAKRPDPFAVDLTPELIVRAYKAGIFPMAEDASSEELFWVSPTWRGILPLDNFHASKSLRKAMRRSDVAIRVDTDFDAIIEGCATSGTDRDTTWISGPIRSLYRALFDQGIAHTVEVWEGPDLVGGLYGLSLGAAFFGESMFHRKTDTSKMALAHLVDRLNAGSYSLLDTQFVTDHLRSLGGIEISRTDYERRLAQALEHEGDFQAWDRKAPAPPS